MNLFNEMKEQEQHMQWEFSSMDNNFGQEDAENAYHPTSLFAQSHQLFEQEFETPSLARNQSLFQNTSDQGIDKPNCEAMVAEIVDGLHHQKDARIENRKEPEFWGSNPSKTTSLNGEEEFVSFLNPEPVPENDEELYLKLDEFTQKLQDDFEAPQQDDQIQDIHSWVTPEVEEDITIEASQPTPKKLKVNCEKQSLPFNSTEDDSSSNDVKSDIVVTTEEATSALKTNGFENYAASYSWSQHQSYYLALEGRVDTSTTKGSSDKESNALSIRRSCFRALSAYFKNTFSKFNRAWQDKRRNKKKTKDMNSFIDTYIREEFGDEISSMEPEFYKNLRDAVISILHSHRYKKKEEFTKDINFSTIRDVLYSYTLEARQRFMSQPAFALIYHHFFVNGAYNFLISKVRCKSKVTAFELEKEIITLHHDAVTTLQ